MKSKILAIFALFLVSAPLYCVEANPESKAHDRDIKSLHRSIEKGLDREFVMLLLQKKMMLSADEIADLQRYCIENQAKYLNSSEQREDGNRIANVVLIVSMLGALAATCEPFKNDFDLQFGLSMLAGLGIYGASFFKLLSFVESRDALPKMKALANIKHYLDALVFNASLMGK